MSASTLPAPLPLRRRSVLLHGLLVAVRHPGAIVWTYVANLGLALVFSLRLHAQLGELLNHSLVAERLNSAFDLGVVAAVFMRLGNHVPSSGATGYAGLPLYFAVYFILVPGALFCYRAGAPGRLAILLSSGLCFFWRFVRIMLLTVGVSALVLGPLLVAQNLWSDHVVEHVVGVAQVWHMVPGWVLILLVASVLRLYFDLVEAYTVQLDDHYRPSGRPDRRVRKTLLPAARTLGRNLPRALGSFVLLALFGAAAMALTGRIALHMLAQPRVWPAFLLLQVGLFVNLAVRYWQRGTETVLVADYPLPGTLLLRDEVDSALAQPSCSSYVYGKDRPFPVEASPAVLGTVRDPLDAQPNPEPATPSVRKSDSGIFRVYPPVE